MLVAAVISAQCAVFTQTVSTTRVLRSGKSTKQNAHKGVPALDTQSLMNTFGFNEKIKIKIYMRVD